MNRTMEKISLSNLTTITREIKELLSCSSELSLSEKEIYEYRHLVRNLMSRAQDIHDRLEITN